MQKNVIMKEGDIGGDILVIPERELYIKLQTLGQYYDTSVLNHDRIYKGLFFCHKHPVCNEVTVGSNWKPVP